MPPRRLLRIYALERIAAKMSCALGFSPSVTGVAVGVGAGVGAGAGVGSCQPVSVTVSATGAGATGAGVGAATGAGAAPLLFGALFDVSSCTPAGR